MRKDFFSLSINNTYSLYILSPSMIGDKSTVTRFSLMVIKLQFCTLDQMFSLLETKTLISSLL
ncbi:MAG: hypothetical protein AB8U61_02720 [Rickettsiales endosymbiont of Dermacentor nuttalli]